MPEWLAPYRGIRVRQDDVTGVPLSDFLSELSAKTNLQAASAYAPVPLLITVCLVSVMLGRELTFITVYSRLKSPLRNMMAWNMRSLVLCRVHRQCHMSWCPASVAISSWRNSKKWAVGRKAQ